MLNMFFTKTGSLPLFLPFTVHERTSQSSMFPSRRPWNTLCASPKISDLNQGGENVKL